MKITGVSWDSCPNGIDCEKTYDTDAGGKLMRLDRSRLVDPAAVGVNLPAHEFLVFVPDEQWEGGRA
jgi:hypothetical protein